MKLRRVINKRLRSNNVAGGVHAVVSVNANEPGGSVSKVSSRQRIVQRNGETVIFEQQHEAQDEKGETNGWE